MFVEEALVVVLEETRTDIEKALVEICDVKIKLEFVTIPDSVDWGTADSLRHIRDKIKVGGQSHSTIAACVEFCILGY